jgi:hypothetical protein
MCRRREHLKNTSLARYASHTASFSAWSEPERSENQDEMQRKLSQTWDFNILSRLKDYQETRVFLISGRAFPEFYFYSLRNRVHCQLFL